MDSIVTMIIHDLPELCPNCNNTIVVEPLVEVAEICKCEDITITQKIKQIQAICVCKVVDTTPVIRAIKELCVCEEINSIPKVEYDIITEEEFVFCLPALLNEMNLKKNCKYNPKGC